MRNFFERFMIFMQGRYGMDTLNGFLIALSFVVWFVNIFIFNLLVHSIVFLFQLAIIGWVVFRAFSQNITMRSKENRTFVKVYDPVKNWVKLTWKRFKDRKDYRYLKCPICKAQLRVRNKKGSHHVRCPKCGSEFETKIR